MRMGPEIRPLEKGRNPLSWLLYISEGVEGAHLSSPCIPPGHESKWTYSGNEYTVV